MERHFDEELADLKNELLRMDSLTEAAIFDSVEALKSLDSEAARKIIDNDKKIDELELEIDKICIDLLALRQPMAGDLRFITMIMEITTNLERIADLAVDIAQRVLEICDKPLLKPLIDIPKLTNLSLSMVHDALQSFVNSDVGLAKQVILRDRQVDQLRDLVQSELINDYMLKDKTAIPRAVALLLIARHLERICDHATNIAEDIIYMVEGKVVKHHIENLDNGN